VGDDIYAGKDGTVYRKGDNGWEVELGSGWSSWRGADAYSPAGGSASGQGGRRTPPLSRPAAGRRPGSSPRFTAARRRTASSSPNIQSLDGRAPPRPGQMRTQGYSSGAYRSAAACAAGPPPLKR